MKEINQALFNIQIECPSIEKDGKNPHFKSSYATLPNVLSILKPLFIKHKVFYSAQQVIKDNAEYLIVSLYHLESGESKTTDIRLLNASDMQKLGSATTYAMRYGLLELLGLCPDIDDDGNKNAGVDDKISKTEIKESETVKKLRKLFELKGEVLLQKKQTSYNNLKGFLNGDKDKQMPYNLQLEALKYLESL